MRLLVPIIQRFERRCELLDRFFLFSRNSFVAVKLLFLCVCVFFLEKSDLHDKVVVGEMSARFGLKQDLGRFG